MVWVLIVIAESMHGIIRQLYIVPLTGELAARQLGVLIGSAIIFAIAWGSVRWINARSFGAQFIVGLLWVVLIVLFEFSLGAALGYSRQRMFSDYNMAEGGLMPLGLLFMLFAPALAARLRGLHK
ncbi:MAG: hypothetical protein COW18_13770 [Zetaproteobacteria bacterium CG12_big_fil_rev_8_21_14_0_65_54_13]|nr:MAG: hypothetical protein COX55_05585 [Zetaproteobacteria bacterium CG23_combo_of_CG06-09_8_20_14_all_54_7]PIW44159.1 MAG: hypothetical protein COW18_13770 [Zetaproteobacteria bacterium CG12_big_fil_rev_8_21_14_0_65_54_13]PIX54155.1 MAG: hypothetical protein COZ50_09570 [Zetaproteobacteria bacterium CG_4_10_14_3_um_filter_54_28]PJA30308.1 MAG: hypothetical protein CO188_04120 [Zetaproteobacteria bacterium CG_4_9_14_3_um_filter_54_145]